jgi:hypothetical protein
LTSETTRLIATFGLGVSGFKHCRNYANNPGNCPQRRIQGMAEIIRHAKIKNGRE